MDAIEHAVVSPSSMGRCIPDRCPGSAVATSQIPEVRDPTSGAALGEEAHDVIRMALLDLFADREVKVKTKKPELKFLVDRALGWLLSTIPRALEYEAWIEQRVDICDENGNVITWGRPDLVLVGSREVVVVDWKFSHEHLDEIDALCQIQAYALGAMQKAGRASARGLLYLPRLNHQYDGTFELEKTRSQVTQIVTGALLPNAPKRAGTWCRWCRASVSCEEIAKVQDHLMAIAPPQEQGVSRPKLVEMIGAKLAEVNHEQVETIADFARIAEAACEAARRFIRAAKEENPDSFPGWELKEIKIRQSVNIEDLWRRLQSVLSAEDVSRCLSITWGALEQVYSVRVSEEAEARGEKLPKASAKRLLDDLLIGVVEYGTRTQLRRRRDATIQEHENVHRRVPSDQD